MFVQSVLKISQESIVVIDIIGICTMVKAKSSEWLIMWWDEFQDSINPFAYRSKQKQYNPVGQMPEGSDLFKQKNRGDASNLDPTEMMRIAMGMA
jgi:hypothetical protein